MNVSNREQSFDVHTYLSSLMQFIEIDRIRRFFYLRYCDNPSKTNMETFLKWREKADKAEAIYKAHIKG